MTCYLQVLSTMAFKDVLSNHRLPAVTVTSVPTVPLQYSRSWQFTTLHPWLKGKFVVTHHEHTVFVLDPVNGVLVGASTFQEHVLSVSISGGFLYILLAATSSKSIVRVALHHSYVPVEDILKKPFPCEVNISSPSSSLENLLREADSEGSAPSDKELPLVKQACETVSVSKSVDNDIGTNERPMESSTQSTHIQKLTSLNDFTSESQCASEVMNDSSGSGDGGSGDGGSGDGGSGDGVSGCGDGVSGSVDGVSGSSDGGSGDGGSGDGVSRSGDTLTRTTSDSTVTAHHRIEEIHGTDESPGNLSTDIMFKDSSRTDHNLLLKANSKENSQEDQSAVYFSFERPLCVECPGEGDNVTAAVSTADNAVSHVPVTCGQDEVGGLNDSTHNPVITDPTNSSTQNVTNNTIDAELQSGTATSTAQVEVPSTDKEQSRRMRMLQAGGDDIVADSKPSRKKKRRSTKGKKLSSATSK